MDKKEYEFDKKLISDNIKFISRNEFNRFTANIRCDRHNGLLKKFVVTIRIDAEYYQIGDNCYNSIKIKLSEIRGKSLKFIKDDLEETYDKYLREKFNKPKLNSKPGKGSYKHDVDWNIYKELKWDFEHGGLPSFKEEEYKKLKEKFRKLKAIDKNLKEII